MTKLERASAAEQAIVRHRSTKGETRAPSDVEIVDLLVDLRHLCDIRSLDFAALDATSYDRYVSENKR